MMAIVQRAFPEIIRAPCLRISDIQGVNDFCSKVDIQGIKYLQGSGYPGGKVSFQVKNVRYPGGKHLYKRGYPGD